MFIIECACLDMLHAQPERVCKPLEQPAARPRARLAQPPRLLAVHHLLGSALVPHVDHQVAEGVASLLEPPAAAQEHLVGAHVPVVPPHVRVIDADGLWHLWHPLLALHRAQVRAPQQSVRREGVVVVWDAVQQRWRRCRLH